MFGDTAFRIQDDAQNKFLYRANEDGSQEEAQEAQGAQRAQGAPENKCLTTFLKSNSSGIALIVFAIVHSLINKGRVIDYVSILLTSIIAVSRSVALKHAFTWNYFKGEQYSFKELAWLFVMYVVPLLYFVILITIELAMKWDVEDCPNRNFKSNVTMLILSFIVLLIAGVWEYTRFRHNFGNSFIMFRRRIRDSLMINR